MKATVISSLFLSLLLAANSTFADFAGGDGSAGNPWQIETPEQLDSVRYDLAAHYILTADIDLGEATGEPSGVFWNGGDGWEPIGATLGSSFTGSIDGNGFKISGLFIDRLEEDQAGLFGWISFGAVLTGLALESANITGNSLVGALVVTNFGGTVENSYVSGTVNGYDFVGGLVGRNHSGVLQNSYFDGNVSGFDTVGGLVGSNWAQVSNSYAAASVSGHANVGALVGVSSSQVENSYWDSESSDVLSSSGGGLGLSVAQMREQASFPGFDFDTTWHVQESTAFPVLVNNPQNPAPGGADDAPDEPGNTDFQIIRSEIQDTAFIGTVFITATGVLNGGMVSGNIRNLGLITGEVTLGAGTVIRGGAISGAIEGTGSSPGLINDARIVAGASLSNVVIGYGTEVDPDVRLGPNVRFTSADSIPPGMDLTGALPALSWTAGDGRSVPDLSVDVLVPNAETFPSSTIDSIQLPEEFTPFEIRQDGSHGELSIVIDETRITLLPYKVLQASPDAEAGVFVNDDGDVVFVTTNHREVTAFPVVADFALFQSELDKYGLELEYGESATIRLFAADETAGNSGFVSARADVLAVPATAAEEAGLFLEERPGLENAYMLNLVFADVNGTLMQQKLVSMPTDWQALKSALGAVAGTSSVLINPQGIISMVFDDGESVEARMDFVVTDSIISVDETPDFVDFVSIGDANEDGTVDFQVDYTGGVSQLMWVFP